VSAPSDGTGTTCSVVAVGSSAVWESEPGAAPKRTRLSVATSVRQRTMMPPGVAVCR
jgi:hypothetical protein